jgi:hypothetical protein
MAHAANPAPNLGTSRDTKSDATESFSNRQQARYDLRKIIKTSRKARDACPSLPPLVHRHTKKRAVRIKLVGRWSKSRSPSDVVPPENNPRGTHDNTPELLGSLTPDLDDRQAISSTKRVDKWLPALSRNEGLEVSGEFDIKCPSDMRCTPDYSPLLTLAQPKSSTSFSLPGSNELAHQSSSLAIPNQSFPAISSVRHRRPIEYITVYNRYRDLHSLRHLPTRNWIFRKSSDGSRALMFYWLGSRLVGIYDQKSAGWLFEDRKFLDDVKSGSMDPGQVDRESQNEKCGLHSKTEDEVASPLWPGQRFDGNLSIWIF